MATVSTIAIKLEAQTAQLKKGFDDAQKATKNLGTSIKSGLGAGFMKFNAIVTATQTVVNGVFNAFGKLHARISEMANIADFADRIQINVERLQELRMVAEQFGGNADQLNTSLQRMTRLMTQGAQRGGPLAKSLAAVGFDIRKIAQMSPDRQFLVMAEAIGQLDTAGEQAALAMLAMETEGVSLLETMRQGPEAIDEMMRSMNGLGVATQEQYQQAQQLDAQLKVLSGVWSEMKDAILFEFVPALIVSVEWMKEAVIWTGETYRAYREWWAWMTGGALEAPMVRVAKNVKDTIDEARGGIEGLIDKAGKAGRIKVPGVGAESSTSGAGFSAYQEARQRYEDTARHEKKVEEIAEESRDLLSVIAERLNFVPVGIA